MQLFPVASAEGIDGGKGLCKADDLVLIENGDAVAAPRPRACGLLWWNANGAERHVSCPCSAGGSEEVGRPPRSLPRLPLKHLAV